MSGTIDVSPNMNSGVVVGKPGFPYFSAYITSSHASQPSGTGLFFRSSGNSGTASNYGITTSVDTHDTFNSVTGVFLPRVKGLYQISGWYTLDNLRAAGRVNCSFKDESDANIGYKSSHTAFVQAISAENNIIREMNGTTNSLSMELYFESDQAETLLGGLNHSRFSAYRIG